MDSLLEFASIPFRIRGSLMLRCFRQLESDLSMSRSCVYLRCFRSLCLARVTYWWAHLMHICGVDQQLMCIFTVLPLTLPSLSDLLMSRSYAYLRCFRSLCLARVTHWWVAFMHIYGASAHFAYLEWPVDEQILCIFTVLPPTLPS